MDNSGNTELNYCYKCMTRLESGQTVCPACGHDNTRHQNTENALPEGTILAGKYLVGCVLGQGGFGITYLGFDTALNIKVAIKEYFPAGIGTRSPSSIRVTPISAQVQEESFRKGCDEFQEEARRLAAIDSPYIVKVRDYFRENGTAYIIMNYLEGKSLTKEVAECGGKIPWQRVVDLFKPLILEMDKLHEDHLIHRDIKPDNIKLVKDKKGTEHLVLLDFGAARSFISAEATGTYSAMVTQGYAPVEQYSRKAHQGPYTDIYALCATMYAAITGTRPPQSNDRMMGLAELPSFSELGIDVPEPIERAVFHGLEVRSEDRPQSMKELYDELEGKKPAGRGSSAVHGEKSAPEPRIGEKPSAEVKPAPQPEPKKKLSWLVPVLLAVLAAAGFFLYRGIRRSQQDTAAAQTSIAETSAQIVLELAARSTQDVQITQTAQAGMTEQAAAAGTQTARETQDALYAEQTGTAWNLTAAAELQQTKTHAAADARATQAEQESRAEQTVQVETQAALNTAAALQSEQTATAWFTTQEEQLHQTETRAAKDLQETRAFFAMQTATQGAAEALEQTRVMSEQQTATHSAIEALQTETAIAEQTRMMSEHQTATQAAMEGIQTRTAAVEQTLAAQQTATRSAEELGLTQTASAKRTAIAEQTAGALEQIRIELEQTEAAFHVMETEAAYEETRQAMEMRMTDLAATKTKAAEPTATPTPEATATATATLTPTMTNTPEPTATPTKKPLREGDVITFGRYEQDGDLNNGAEAIEWQVLAVEEDRAMVISKYGLDTRKYNEKRTNVTWETCTLRAWLNGEFYNSMFSEAEKVQIQEVRVNDPNNPTYGTKGGNDTTDRIFLLSIEEANRYFANDEERKCWPTTYAKNNGAYIRESRGDTTWWWLRSPGYIVDYAAVVSTDGKVNGGGGVDSIGGVVRPAFWLNLVETGNSIEGDWMVEVLAPSITPVPTATATATKTPTLTPTPEPMATTIKKPLKVGDIITFGQYEQDSNMTNGAEVIEWQVLAVEENRALVISKYGLDAKKYNEKRTNVNWEKCTLRTWLNGDFFNSAFSEAEKVQILEVKVKNPDNPTYGTKDGNDTTDRIFLLSIEEAKQYFGSDEARRCWPTTYAKNNGAYIRGGRGGTTWWWLRSPGYIVEYAAVVSTDGNVNGGGGVDSIGGVVRPAFWLNFESQPRFVGRPEMGLLSSAAVLKEIFNKPQSADLAGRIVL